MKVAYLPVFTKRFNKLDASLQQRVLESIELFKDPKNHKTLKVHKLHGVLKNRYSFSVDYKHRIVFTYLKKDEAVLLAIGDHSIYE